MVGRIVLVRALTALLGAALVLGAPSTARLAAATADASDSGRFTDDDDSVFEADIERLAAAGITRGCGDGTRFCPTEYVTRGEFAAFMSRALDLPTGRATFSDTRGHLFEAAVAALADAGITKGCGDGRFCPDRHVTRGQLAAFLDRALDLPDGPPVFSDTCGHRFEENIEALAATRITRGCGDGTMFCPDDPVTRGQLAAFFVRAGLTEEDPLARFGGGSGSGGSGSDGSWPDDPDRCEPAVLTSREGHLVAGGSSAAVGSGTVRTYTVEVEATLADRQDVTAFATFVDATLQDRERGWTVAGAHRLQRVDDPEAAGFRLLLATPATVDRLCARAGLNTAGRFSCWNGRFAAINSDRWFGGVDHVSDLTLYRQYVVNHESGHALGYGHRSCPGTGRLAPVMMQLTKSTYGCVPNAWPAP